MKKIIVIGVIIFSVFFVAAGSFAETGRIDYAGQPAIDSDLDGLSDQGEIQIYGTDMRNPDTDGDSFLDGAEVINHTDPTDTNDPLITSRQMLAAEVSAVTPWAWYAARAAGLIGFIFLWLTIFLGLAIRNPLLKKIIQPIYSFDFHCFAAAMAVILALIHGTALLFDDFLKFGAKDVFVPFYSQVMVINSNYLALGTLAFYAMVIMTITSYLRCHMAHWLWRVLHFLSPIAFIFTVLHGYQIGTDMQNVYVKYAFLGLSGLLTLIYLSSLVAVVRARLEKQDDQESDVLKKC